MTYLNQDPEFNHITWDHKKQMFVDREGQLLTREQAIAVRWICRICNQPFSRKDILIEHKRSFHAY
jgi:hypothetical protein